MSVNQMSVNAADTKESEKKLSPEELALKLFNYENFLLVAIQHHRTQDKRLTTRLKSLSPTTRKAILSLAAILPPPQSQWQEFAETLEYPMSTRLEEIKTLENDLLKLSEEKQLAAYRTKERQLQAKTIDLQKHILKKEAQKQKLLKLITQSLQNDKNHAQMKQALTEIETSKARSKKYARLQSGAEEALEITGWLGNGPFPFNPIGQILAPIPLLVARLAFTLNNRNNPSTMPAKLSQKLDTAGVIAGVSAVVITVVATVSTPVLPVIAAGAILLNNMTSTVTAYQKYKKSKAIIETPEGKKIRTRGHIADILGNIAGVVACTGAFGMVLATALAVTTVAFPPATLALLTTIGLGVTIAAITLSATAYFRKTELLKEANNQKIVFDFKNACEHGALNEINLSLDDQQLRSLASSKQYRTEPIPLLATVSQSNSPAMSNEAIIDEKTIKQFEQVLALGFIPKLIPPNKEMILKAAPNTYIQITHHTPPDPNVAIEAIKKMGGIPKFSDPKEQDKMLTTHPREQQEPSKTAEPEHQPPALSFHPLSPPHSTNPPSPPQENPPDIHSKTKKP